MTYRPFARLPLGRVSAFVVSVAAGGALLTACDNGEHPTSTPGTTPAVVNREADIPGAPVQYEGDEGAARKLTASLISATGASAGTATFAAEKELLKVTLRVMGLPAGRHMVSLHSVGVCDASGATPFASAGGLVPGGALVAVNVTADGSGELVTTTDSVKLADVKNKAVVVERGAAAAGSAVACGVIE